MAVLQVDKSAKPRVSSESHVDDAQTTVQILFTRLRDLPRRHPDYSRTRNRIIELCLPLAKQLAHKFKNRGEPHDDLLQVAYLGLVKSVDRYDHRRNSHFVSYAVPTIIGELKRYFRDKSWTMHVPRRVQELRLQITAATNEMTQELGHAPTVTELANCLAITEEEVLEGLDSRNAYHTVSWHTPVRSGEEAVELGDLLGKFDHNLTHIENRETIRTLITTLPHREQHILYLRFYGNMTQSQIGQKIGLSQMQVSRLLTRSLRSLRNQL